MGLVGDFEKGEGGVGEWRCGLPGVDFGDGPVVFSEVGGGLAADFGKASRDEEGGLGVEVG